MGAYIWPILQLWCSLLEKYILFLFLWFLLSLSFRCRSIRQWHHGNMFCLQWNIFNASLHCNYFLCLSFIGTLNSIVVHPCPVSIHSVSFFIFVRGCVSVLAFIFLWKASISKSGLRVALNFSMRFLTDKFCLVDIKCTPVLEEFPVGFWHAGCNCQLLGFYLRSSSLMYS